MTHLITTLGPKSADELGMILPHEHIFVDLGPIEAENWRNATAEPVIALMTPYVEEIKAQLGGELVAAAPQCEHGHRVWRQGEKNGRAWANYSCVEKVRTKQCPPVWYVLSSENQWKPQL